MGIEFNRGDIYYCKELLLYHSTTRNWIIKNKFILILQGGLLFKSHTRVNGVLGTRTIEKKYKTDLMIDPSDVIHEPRAINKINKITKFNCAEIYLFVKEDLLKQEKVGAITDKKMSKLDYVLVEALCMQLET